MGTLENWLDACLSCAQGQLFIDNLGIDLIASNVDEDLVLSFGRGVIDPKTVAGLKSNIPAGVEAFARAAASVISREKLYLSGRKITIPDEKLQFVFRLDMFQSLLWFDFSSVGGLDDFETAESILAVLESVRDRSALLAPGASMRSSLPMAWITFADAIASTLRLASGDKADVVRDSLGLLHYSQDSFLCTIELKRSEIDVSDLRRPCALDAGATLVFRSNPAVESVGRAVHLSSGKAALPEMVCPPIPLRADHKIEPLGRVTRSPAFNWTLLVGDIDNTRIDAAKSVILRS